MFLDDICKNYRLSKAKLIEQLTKHAVKVSTAFRRAEVLQLVRDREA